MAEEKKQDQGKKGGGLVGKLVSVLLIAIIGFAAFLMYKQSQRIGKGPWEWSGGDWSEFVRFAGTESKKTLDKAKGWIGNISGLKDKAASSQEGPVGDNVDPKAVAQYRQGSKELNDACVLWQDAQTLDDGPAKVKKYEQAKATFESAIAKLEAAREIDETVDPEIDAMIDAAEHYQEACADKLDQ